MISPKLSASIMAASLGFASANLRVSQESRHLQAYSPIAGYEAKSLVTDHNAIDLDMSIIFSQIREETDESFAIAKDVYMNGAFSKSVAKVTLTNPLAVALDKKTKVTGTAKDGSQVTGTLYDAYNVGDTVIEIQYEVSADQTNYVKCQVGGNPEPYTDGCLSENDSLTIEGQGSFAYTYDILSDNNNKRTIQGFSTSAKEKMFECDNCPYTTYKKFYDYYGNYAYGDEWVMAAFEGRSTDFTNGVAHFDRFDKSGLGQAISKGAAFMNIWMYVIREMEDALDDCQEGCTLDNCNDDPVHAWDEAVAFYTGSQEGTLGDGQGSLIYALADRTCRAFKTCGDLANSVDGTAHVNIEIFRQFKDGQRKLLEGRCNDAKANKERIENLMAVPLIHGTLRYARINDWEPNPGDKEVVELSTYSATILPLVHACDPAAAATIYEHVNSEQTGEADYVIVKEALESAYECMGLRCEDIGGYWDAETDSYLKDSSPCGMSSNDADDDNKTGVIVGATIGGAVLAALIVIIFQRLATGKETVTGDGEAKGPNTTEVS